MYKKYADKPLLSIFSILFILMAVFFIIKIIMPCREYTFDSGYDFVEGEATENTVVCDGISLSPGVYRVELKYESSEDLNALCNVSDATVFTGGLLSNGEHIYSALHETSYDMWLYESTDNLQITISYSGEGTLSTGALKIVETNGLWTMLLTILAVIGIAVYGYMFYSCKRKAHMESGKKHVLFCIVVIALAASVPNLCGYNIAGADLTYHLLRIEGVKDGLLSGQFPVKIEPKWLYNHGYANAVFYCNSLLYFPAILRILGFTISTSYNAYCIALNFATATIAYYCFKGMFGNNNIGIVCSALYTLSIIRIYKVAVTGAVGESSAITFIPLVFYGLYRIFTENSKEKKYKTAWVPLLFGYAGLIQTHVLSCEITAFVTLIFCVIYIRKMFNKKIFSVFVKGCISAVLISLWYLVPFLDYYLTQDVHIKHVSSRTIQHEGLYIAQLAFHFWKTGDNVNFSENGMKDSHPISLGFVLLAGLIIFLILWFLGKFKKNNDNSDGRTGFIKVTAVIGTLLLIMSLSAFPWDSIQALNPIVASLVSSLQFPERFLGWSSCCTAAVFGYCMYYFKNKKLDWAYLSMALLAVIGITTSSMYLMDYLNCEDGYFELYNEEGMGFGYISGAEYLLQGTQEDKLTFADAVCGNGVEITEYTAGSLNADIECVNTEGEDSYIDLPLLLYKGYKAKDTLTGSKLQISAGENNLVRVNIPAEFSGNVKVYFESPFYWRISELISLIFTLVTAFILWRYSEYCRRNKVCI